MIKQLNLKIEENLHTKLKVYCANNKTSINEITIKFYEKLLEKNGSGRI